MTIQVLDLEYIKDDVEKQNKYSVEAITEKIIAKLEKELKKYDRLSKLTDEEIKALKEKNKNSKEHTSYRMTLIKSNKKGRYIPLRYGTLLVCGALVDDKVDDRQNIVDTISMLKQGQFYKKIEKWINEDPKFLEMKERFSKDDGGQYKE